MPSTRENSIGEKKHALMTSASPQKVHKGISNEEFRQIFLENKRKKLGQKVSRKFTYRHSENYQNIERLLASCGRSFKARATLPEFQILEELCKKKVEKKRKVIQKQDDYREPYITRIFKSRRGK